MQQLDKDISDEPSGEQPQSVEEEGPREMGMDVSGAGEVERTALIKRVERLRELSEQKEC